MPVPFESFVPFGVMTAMFLATATGIRFAQTKRNEGKAVRYSLDDWDRKMMARDHQLTGTMRGQVDDIIAPPQFKVNSSWKVYESLRNDFA
ncbi:hypothetical protein GGI05_005968 [Coemansia sp. RSA 2603]|nr:hypothetical protein GGI05_005968 [Coemansia sp. RSA 2603]